MIFSHKSLVSILTPCYNAENLVTRLFDSILIQDYDNMEVIIINDGSTDDTLSVLERYSSLFNEKNIPYKYVSQVNQGLANTINNGLKMINGDYLIWPDADDWFNSSSAISRMVQILDSKKDYSCVRVLANYINEETRKETPIIPIDPTKEDLFEDFFYWNDNIWAPAGSHMIRVNTLFNQLDNKNIYSNRHGGQNYQLMLPVLYHNKCYTIQEHLFNILVRKGSHSRGTYSAYNKEILRWKDSIDLMVHTISSIKTMEKEQKIAYHNRIHRRYNKYMANSAKHHRHPLDFIKYTFLQTVYKLKSNK